jgi:hypothetical protein
VNVKVGLLARLKNIAREAKLFQRFDTTTKLNTKKMFKSSQYFFAFFRIFFLRQRKSKQLPIDLNDPAPSKNRVLFSYIFVQGAFFSSHVTSVFTFCESMLSSAPTPSTL